MRMRFFQVAIISLLLQINQTCCLKLRIPPLCTITNDSLCSTSETYNPLRPPGSTEESGPSFINPRIGIRSIEVNEERHTLKLLMEVKLDWIDKNLDLVNYNSDWFQIIGSGLMIWHPTLYFEHLVDIKKLIGFGEDQNVQFWFYRRHQTLYYTEVIEVTVACEMAFNRFPYDKHVCDLIFGAYNFNTKTILYNAPIVVYDDGRIDMENETLEVQKVSSKYDIKISQIQPLKNNFKIKGLKKGDKT